MAALASPPPAALPCCNPPCAAAPETAAVVAAPGFLVPALALAVPGASNSASDIFLKPKADAY